MTRQRRCRICHERPPWHGKNCPPGICKRCYHREIWVDRPAARRERLRAERAASTDPSRTSPARWSMTAISTPSARRICSLVTLLTWRPSPSGKRRTACPGIPTLRATTRNPSQPPLAPRIPRPLSMEHPRCRLCRKVRHHYAESADGLLRVCLGCAGGLPLAQLTAADAAAELIAQRRPVHRRDFVERLRARFPELPWDTGIVREGQQRRHVRKTTSDTIAGAVVNPPNQA